MEPHHLWLRSALANAGHDTRALQAYLGHRNIQHTVRYTELSPTRFKNFWRECGLEAGAQLRAVKVALLSRQWPPTKTALKKKEAPTYDQGASFTSV